jgi:ribose transport system permease protein
LLAGFFILKFTRFGRNIYVIGSGMEVAKLSGVNTRLTTYGVYVFAGLVCGIAGVLLTSRVNSAVPTAGTGYEMSAIAATVIGGASLSGAKGAVWGTALGTVLMILIDNGGIQLGIDPFIMEVSTGVLITVAVIIDMSRSKKR